MSRKVIGMASVTTQQFIINMNQRVANSLNYRTQIPGHQASNRVHISNACFRSFSVKVRQILSAVALIRNDT